MRVLWVAGLALLLPAGAALAKPKGMRFWNLTAETLVEVALAPAGTSRFGPNQCLNDKDKSVDFDEDVRVTGVAPGRYDIRTKDGKGRTCLARNVEVKADEVFSVGEKDLTDCAN